MSPQKLKYWNYSREYFLTFTILRAIETTFSWRLCRWHLLRRQMLDFVPKTPPQKQLRRQINVVSIGEVIQTTIYRCHLYNSFFFFGENKFVFKKKKRSPGSFMLFVSNMSPWTRFVPCIRPDGIPRMGLNKSKGKSQNAWKDGKEWLGIYWVLTTICN